MSQPIELKGAFLIELTDQEEPIEKKAGVSRVWLHDFGVQIAPATGMPGITLYIPWARIRHVAADTSN